MSFNSFDRISAAGHPQRAYLLRVPCRAAYLFFRACIITASKKDIGEAALRKDRFFWRQITGQRWSDEANETAEQTHDDKENTEANNQTLFRICLLDNTEANEQDNNANEQNEQATAEITCPFPTPGCCDQASTRRAIRFFNVHFCPFPFFGFRFVSLTANCLYLPVHHYMPPSRMAQ